MESTHGYTGLAADLMQLLPAEMVSSALDYLPEADLKRVAGVSRRLRAIVKKDPRFVISLGVRCELDVDSYAQLRNVLTVLAYALPEQLRIKLTVECKCELDDTLRNDFYALRRVFVCQEVFGAIATALPDLVELDMDIPDEYRPSLHDALRREAPRLTKLRLARDNYNVRRPFTTHVPSDLFRGVAPKLADVTLRNVSPGAQPVPAFARATHVALDYSFSTPPICVAEHFPAVTHLGISFWSGEAPVLLAPAIDLRRLSLRRLDISEPFDYPLVPAINEQLDLSTVPVVALEGCECVHEPAVWAGMSGPLCLQMCHQAAGRELLIAINSAQPQLQRTFEFTAWEDDADAPDAGYPLSHCHMYAERLVDIRVDHEFILGVLELAVVLPELRRLQFDFPSASSAYGIVWPSDIYNDSEDEDEDEIQTQWLIACPQLESLTMFAVDQPATISPRDAGRLGCAFGQVDRPPEQRARLFMRGVAFDESESCNLVEQIFPRIQYLEFDDRAAGVESVHPE